MTRTIVLGLSLLSLPAAAVAGGGIPAGHLPPPGECRVWFFDRPAGHQPPPTDCRTAERTAPYGSTVVYGADRGSGPRYGGYEVEVHIEPCPYDHDHERYDRNWRSRRAQPRYQAPLPPRAPEYEYREHRSRPDSHERYERRGYDQWDSDWDSDSDYDSDSDSDSDSDWDSERRYRSQGYDKPRYESDDRRWEYDASRQRPQVVPAPEPRRDEGDYLPEDRLPNPPVIELPPAPSSPEVEPSVSSRSLFPLGEDTLVLDGVEFESDSIDLTQEAIWTLDGVAEALVASPDLMVEIGGHTDSKGRKDYNRLLSVVRAEEVREYLVSKGVDSTRLFVRGYGESDPIASNRSDAGRARNRRIELRRLDLEPS